MTQNNQIWKQNGKTGNSMWSTSSLCLIDNSGILDSEKGLAHHVCWGDRLHHWRQGPGGVDDGLRLTKGNKKVMAAEFTWLVFVCRGLDYTALLIIIPFIQFQSQRGEFDCFYSVILSNEWNWIKYSFSLACDKQNGKKGKRDRCKIIQKN